MTGLVLHFARSDGTNVGQEVGSITEAVATAFMALEHRALVTGFPLEVRETTGALVMDQEELLVRASDYSMTIAYPDFARMH